MFNFIENLRGKSEGYRRTVALGISFVVTAGLLGVWATVSFPGGVSNQAVVASKSTNVEPEKPMASVGRNMAQAYEAVKTEWNSIIGSFTGNIKYEANGPSNNQLQVMPNDRNPATNMDRTVVY